MAQTIAHPAPSKVSARLSMLHRVLEEAGLPFEAMQWPIDDKEFRRKLVEFWSAEGRARQSARRFARFNELLLPLNKQLGLLMEYDRQHWRRMLRSQLRSVQNWLNQSELPITAIESLEYLSLQSPQQVDSLQLLYPEFGSPADNVRMWSMVLNPGGHLPLNKGLFGLGPYAYSYEPGIYLVRINLVAHWDPDNGCMAEEIRAWAREQAEVLAAAEVMAVHALQPDLMAVVADALDKFPAMKMVGYEARDPMHMADYWRWVPEIRLIGPGKCRLGAREVNERDYAYSAPVILGEPVKLA